MATEYFEPGDEITTLLGQAMSQWHSGLKIAGVRVDIVMATNEDGPAVKAHGYPAAGKIKVLSLKDRTKRKFDAELTVDSAAWDIMKHAEKMAFLDHELSHLALIPNKPKKGEEDNGTPWKFDSLGRPKLRLLKGDWHVGDGFMHVVERHGEAAIEFSNLRSCYDAAKMALPAATHLKIAQ